MSNPAWHVPAPTPGSPEWLKVMTASKVAAVCGVSPYESPRSLYHRMRGELPEKAQLPHQARGHYLEPAVLAWWRDMNGVIEDETCWEMQVYVVRDGWMAATLDARAVVNGQSVVVEAKTARDAFDWGTPFTDEIPLQYLFQTMWQLHVTGIEEARIPVLTSFLNLYEYVVYYDAEIGDMLERRCREFMAMVEAGTPPPIDDTESTLLAVSQVNNQIVGEESRVEVEYDLARAFITSKGSREEAEAAERLAKSQLREAMGDARHAYCNGVKFARRQNNANGTSLVATVKAAHEIPNFRLETNDD